MTITETETVYCANEDHDGSVYAIARVRWPDGRFHPTTACADCLTFLMGENINGEASERHSVLIDPIPLDGQPLEAYEKPRPAVVCLCGSTRFGEAFRRANLERTLAGEIVLSIGCDTRSDDDLAAAGAFDGVDDLKARLDTLHKQKINLADYVLVVSDETGYFGESTRSEITHAIKNGKPVEFANLAARHRAYELELI